MVYENKSELIDRINMVTHRRIREAPRVITDTSSYMNLVSGTVLRLKDRDYYIITDAREGRFGLDDQPKFWVKYAFDLKTGIKKIIKLVFQEEFTIPFGKLSIRFKRSSKKESAILDAVRGNDRFMQGKTVIDPAGNYVRIIDIIPGPCFYNYIASIDSSHEEYYHSRLPSIIEELVACFEGLSHLHKEGHHHGDVRNDHILIDSKTGMFRWIDFDYGVNFSDFDLWKVGNILTYAVGKGIHTQRDLVRYKADYPQLKGAVTEGDMLLITRSRIANLAKLFPYISASLNDILLRFSSGTDHFYTDFENQLDDLKGVVI